MRNFMASRSTLFSTGQSLQVEHGGAVYRFNILHSTLGEVPRLNRGLNQHAHEVYHIVLFTKGSSKCCFDNAFIPVHRGSLVLTSPNVPHSFNIYDKAECSYHEVTFSFEHPYRGELLIPFDQFLSAYSGLNLKRQAMPLELTEDSTLALERQFIRIMDILEVKSPLAHLDLSLAVGRLLSEIIRLCYLDHQPGSKSMMDRLVDVKEHLEFNYADSESIDDLAKRACLSRGYFLREFKKSVGVSPNAYRIQLRINAAQALLRSSNLQCREIALRTGFSDEFHFSRTFKRVTGKTPSAFRGE